MELTLSDLRELFGQNEARKIHPLHGMKVVAVLPNGFVHFGILNDEGGRYRLSDASNLRYWEKRDGGLPEFTRTGPKDGDKIDKAADIHFDAALFFYKAGNWQ